MRPVSDTTSRVFPASPSMVTVDWFTTILALHSSDDIVISAMLVEAMLCVGAATASVAAIIIACKNVLIVFIFSAKIVRFIYTAKFFKEKNIEGGYIIVVFMLF